MTRNETLYGRFYVDQHGTLRQVMQQYPNGLVRGIDVSTMRIDGLYITPDLESIFTGMYNPEHKRNRVIWR
jgi:hypothetical protein